MAKLQQFLDAPDPAAALEEYLTAIKRGRDESIEAARAEMRGERDAALAQIAALTNARDAAINERNVESGKLQLREAELLDTRDALAAEVAAHAEARRAGDDLADLAGMLAAEVEALEQRLPEYLAAKAAEEKARADALKKLSAQERALLGL